MTQGGGAYRGSRNPHITRLLWIVPGWKRGSALDFIKPIQRSCRGTHVHRGACERCSGVCCVCQPERTKEDPGSLSTFKERRSKDIPLTRVSFLRIKKIINNNGLEQLSVQTGEPELELIGEALIHTPVCGDVRVCAASWQVAMGTNGNRDCKCGLLP